VVPIDVGKHQAMAQVGNFTDEQLVGPFRFPMTRAGVAELVGWVQRVQAAAGVTHLRLGRGEQQHRATRARSPFGPPALIRATLGGPYQRTA
jgi:hypothetical protein